MSATQISPKIKAEPLWRSFYADPHLEFTIEFDIGAKHVLLHLSADVSACTDNTGSNPVVLGMLQLNPEKEHRADSDSIRRVEMILPLTRSAVERIEEQRAKERYHNVCLKVRGHLSVLLAQPRRFSQQSTEMLELRPTSDKPMDTYKFQETVKIASSEWTDKFLDILGLGKYLSIEIPMSLEEAQKKTELAAERALAERVVNSAKLVIDAEKSMREGDWEKAVGDVRRALEFLEKKTVIFQQEEISMTKAIKDLFTINGYPSDVSESVTRMIDSFHTYTNPAHHVQVKETEEEVRIKTPFDKEDAQFAVGTLVLLLNTLAKKLTKRPVG